MLELRATGGRLWGVWDDDGVLVGIIGFMPMAPRWGMFRGICFDRSAHGTGIAARAVRAVLAELFARGFSKVSAWYFADNAVIGRFLRKLGAVDEGILRRHAVRAGEPVDMRLVAFFSN